MAPANNGLRTDMLTSVAVCSAARKSASVVLPQACFLKYVRMPSRKASAPMILCRFFSTEAPLP